MTAAENVYKYVRYITMMGIAKVTTNFQVTIPKDVRQAEGIRVGDTLLFSSAGGRIEVSKEEKRDLLKLVAGSWKYRGTGKKYEDEVRKGWKKRAKMLGY